MQKTEQAYIEEITTIKEQHEMDMGKRHQGVNFFYDRQDCELMRIFNIY